jgi:hypothetical protein
MATKGKFNDDQMDILEGWIGKGPKTFSLLYAITRDGCNATTFHQKCNNQGPTVTVLYNQYGSVYGGYASTSWNSNDAWVTTADSFLFQLSFSGSPKTNKFIVTKQQNSMYGGPSYGPHFGNGSDLQTFTSSVYDAGGYFPLNGNMKAFGTHYNSQGITKDQVNNGTMNVTELEVYKVSGNVVFSK